MEKHMATCRVILVTNSTSKVISSVGSHLRFELKFAGDSCHQIEVPCSSCSCSFPPGYLERCCILYFLNSHLLEFVCTVQPDNMIFRTLQQWSLLWLKRRDVLSPHNLPPGTPANDFFGNPDIVIWLWHEGEKEFGALVKFMLQDCREVW